MLRVALAALAHRMALVADVCGGVHQGLVGARVAPRLAGPEKRAVGQDLKPLVKGT